jgi:integral membrane protein (TIGR01906 family)
MSSEKSKILTRFIIAFLPIFLLERIFMSSRTTKILKLVIVVLLPIFLIVAAVQILTTDQYLALEYGKASFPPDPFGFTQQERLDLASADIHYVRGHLPGNALSNQTLDGVSVYNSREVSHMADVRAVFQAIFRMWQFAWILLLLVGLTLWLKSEQRTLASAIRWGGLLTSGVIVFIGLFAVLAWQSWFSTFHLFFFKPGSWLFSYSDTLIRLFPVEFWFDATLTISFLSFVGALLFVWLGWRWQKVMIERPSV